MRTKLALLAVAFTCLLGAFVALFPKLGAVPFIAFNRAVSEWKMRRWAETHEYYSAVLDATNEELKIHALMQTCAQSKYYVDEAYADAAWHLAEQLQAGFSPDTVWVYSRDFDFDSAYDDVMTRIDAILKDSTALKHAAKKVKDSLLIINYDAGDTAGVRSQND